MGTVVTINRKRKRPSASPKDNLPDNDAPSVNEPKTPKYDPREPPVVSSSSSPNSKSSKRQIKRYSGHVSTKKNLTEDFNSADYEIANSTPEATLLKQLQQLADMMKPSIGCLEKTAEVVPDLIGTSSNPKFTDAWKKASGGVIWLKEGLRMVTEAENLLCPPPPTNANSIISPPSLN